MATVNVNSLSDFIEAVAVSGDTVICPENAVWDANELYPSGRTGNIIIGSEVQGNGTTIKNLRLDGVFRINGEQRKYIYNLNIIDLLGARDTTSQTDVGLFEGNFHLNECRVSAVLNSKYNRIINWFGASDAYAAEFCSFNIDAAGQFDSFYTSNAALFSRIELHLPNSTWPPVQGGTWFSTCEFAIFAPNASGGIPSFRSPGSIWHGEMPGITELWNGGTISWSGDMMLFSTDGMPNFSPYDPAHCKGVTDAQLRDPAYLRSIGFPIAIEG